jgi:hypothetical protein
MAEPTPPPITAQKALAQEQAALQLPPGEAAALCLSGGGIRSAAFCLGVVQGLARLGVLKQFHYLSTVSGGGYVGGYLAARLRAFDGNVDALQEELKHGGNAPWLTRLRQSGNFLTPQLGLFSLDTWTGLTLYTRNLLLTWASLLPWMLLLVLGFIFYRTLISVAGHIPPLGFGALGIAAVALAVSSARFCHGLPSHQQAAHRGPATLAGASAPWISRERARGTVYTALAWPLLAPFALGAWKDVGMENPGPTLLRDCDAVVLGAIYAVCVISAFLSAWSDARGEAARRLFRSNIGPWILATLFCAVLTGLGPWLLRCMVPATGRVEVLAVAGPLWFAMAMIIHAGTYMGLRRNAPAAMAELDREWTATMSADIQRIATGVALIGFPILALTDIVIPSGNSGWGSGVWGKLLSPLITGPAVAWLGHQAFTRMSALNDLDARWRDKAMDIGLALLAAIFIATLLALLSALVQSYVLGPVQQWWVSDQPFSLMALLCPACSEPVQLPTLWRIVQDYWGFLQLPPAAVPGPDPGPVSVPVDVLLGVQVALALVLLLAAWVLRIDNNRFTLHAVYRNRLVRGFLGAARNPAGRRPEPVTGFDPEDDVRLAALVPSDANGQAGPRSLFPVVNIAVNVTRTSNPLWAERQALSFTATPLHCGYYLPPAEPQEPDSLSATYVPTPHFNHTLRGEKESAPGPKGLGLGLGTALTISGAAASPNSGYHSRPATAFLMTLFNVRLGLWAPNPRHPRSHAGLTPAEQRRALLDDLRGVSSVDGGAIYLSDGGHFDNLGLYEMLRRRCKFIVVVDAAHDPECSFADLGQSLRKASVDLGARVSLTATRIGPRKPGAENPGLLGFAAGRIEYPATGDLPAAQGELLYIKPTWLADVPMDVRAYGAAEKQFPQQPTSDQWFSESQFESYRSLGTHQLQALALESGQDLVLETLFRRAEARLAATPSP